MNIVLLCMGKTQESYLREGILDYEKRLVRYVRFKRLELPDVKNTSSLSCDQIKEKEGILLLKNIKISDHLVLFDEKGITCTSKQMSFQIEQHMQKGTRNLVFAIGGAYGFSPKIRQRANDAWSLSSLTFPHQLVRLLCIEQIYRCFTIIKGEAYHHE
ncbi:MAG: 23S rRNA (pseudouridine(1915)-N(3))-methyltransferase RlmH [Bacteroidales bacterium]|jgi:23S rRNA (pseudouridine1915-N3)-methyltransferase|nr:23S rRNA (pseudouridine(1915)-N(3))-methyltransferase RlmH [Bacteroidales bacterium]MDD2264182.1 23S rRNA (pseudouridine(1915)-N(3))-methyltransferase RlmH [Bacteroidales bacterium]MDD2831347.1 23S rRNA (pseudouridine(1915)-N(3))-methyltransferase RlmH [Bacteroidales bacterium]MDD3208341.1 23S rRNA (pseudouridine(1915)-N(3))-methyltransferase RlmH [Bacteroidales bacterium]MDD3696976.1 23S rRNA (pseudouridine(1915)-N(3))-methyltransferase RlmH [Bacteroidales bacterium]